MRIIHYLILALLFIASSFFLSNMAHAQQKQPTNSSIGITGSIGASTHLKNFRFVSGDINLDFNPNFTTSYSAGFIIRQKLSDGYRLQAEPSLSRFGARYTEAFELRGFNFQTDSETKLLYVQMPLLLQISTVRPEQTVYGRHRAQTTYHVSAGVFWSYLLNAQFSGENTGAPIGIEFAGTFSNDVIEQYKNFDAGTLVGLGFEYGYGTKVGIEGRVHFSVIDSGNAPEISFKPQNLALSITGYFLF